MCSMKVIDTNHGHGSMEPVIFKCKISHNFWYHCCAINRSFPRAPLWPYIVFPSKRYPIYSHFGVLILKFLFLCSMSLFGLFGTFEMVTLFQEFVPYSKIENKCLFCRLVTWIRWWCPKFSFSPEQMNDK